jgi:hypothetical protein
MRFVRRGPLRHLRTLRNSIPHKQKRGALANQRPSFVSLCGSDSHYGLLADNTPALSTPPGSQRPLSPASIWPATGEMRNPRGG